MPNKWIKSKVLDLVPEELRAKAGERAYESFVALRRKLIGAELREVTLSGDRDISYLVVDGGHKETILFLHGFADSKDTFYDAAHFLVGTYNLICPDLPGFGKSFKRRNDVYSVFNYGQWICEFIEKIGLDRFHIAGNSLGGATALQVGLNIPEKIRTMTLIDPAGIYLPEPYALHHELFDGHVIFDVRNREEFEYFLKRVFTKQPILPHPIKDFLFKEFSRHGLWHRKILADLINGLSSDEDPRIYDMALNKHLEDVKVPTFIIWGDDDSFFPKETALYMAKKIPDCDLHILEDTGHAPQIESPRRFARVFKKFLHKKILHLDKLEKKLGSKASSKKKVPKKAGSKARPNKSRAQGSKSTSSKKTSVKSKKSTTGSALET